MTYDLLVRFIRPPTLMLLTALPFTESRNGFRARTNTHSAVGSENYESTRSENGMRIVAITNDTNKYDHQMLFIIINF